MEEIQNNSINIIFCFANTIGDIESEFSSVCVDFENFAE